MRDSSGKFIKGHVFLGGKSGWFKKGRISDKKGTGKEINCKLCGIVFKSSSGISRNKIFCSRLCRSKYNRGNKNTNYKGGKIKRGKYWAVKTYDHPSAPSDGYIREHRLIMEKYIGRYLLKEEVIHHINGNTLDNRIENLQLFSSDKEHATFHQKLLRESL